MSTITSIDLMELDTLYGPIDIAVLEVSNLWSVPQINEFFQNGGRVNASIRSVIKCLSDNNAPINTPIYLTENAFVNTGSLALDYNDTIYPRTNLVVNKQLSGFWYGFRDKVQDDIYGAPFLSIWKCGNDYSSYLYKFTLNDRYVHEITPTYSGTYFAFGRDMYNQTKIPIDDVNILHVKETGYYFTKIRDIELQYGFSDSANIDSVSFWYDFTYPLYYTKNGISSYIQQNTTTVTINGTTLTHVYKYKYNNITYDNTENFYNNLFDKQPTYNVFYNSKENGVSGNFINDIYKLLSYADIGINGNPLSVTKYLYIKLVGTNYYYRMYATEKTLYNSYRLDVTLCDYENNEINYGDKEIIPIVIMPLINRTPQQILKCSEQIIALNDNSQLTTFQKGIIIGHDTQYHEEYRWVRFTEASLYWGTDFFNIYYPTIPDRYKLLVVNGSGSGDYNENQTVYVESYSLPNKRFLNWTSNYANLEIITGSLSARAFSFRMPTNLVILTAVYEDYIPSTDNDPYTPSAGGHGGTIPGGGEPSSSTSDGTGGGDGTFDFTSDTIENPLVPNIDLLNNNFITSYIPNNTLLNQLANYLWAGAFDVDNFKKLFSNPFDAIIGLTIIPAYDNEPQEGLYRELKVGNVGTGISIPLLLHQFYKADMGTIEINPTWGSYFDYSPYTKISLYLPYIGFQDISADDCMGGSISIEYTIDCLSGACIANVTCKNSNSNSTKNVLYSYTGSVSVPIPISQGQYMNGILGLLRIGGNIAGSILSGGSTIASSMQDAANTAISMIKPEISRSGNFGGSSGIMGIQKPYVVLTIPRMCIPSEQNKYIGYPSLVTQILSQISGYAEIQEIHLQGIGATSTELDEIESLLKGGVIF